MPSTNKTPYAELPQFLPSDKPTWLGDINNAMLKIDGKLSEANTKNTQQDLQISTALENSANAAKAAQAAQTAAEGAVAKADAVSARLPVGTADIKDGAVTATKLDSTAMNAILKGMTIKRFSSMDKSADNDGMVVISNVDLEGFYIVEIGLLVITRFMGDAHTIGSVSSPNCYLPSYVQIAKKDYSGLTIVYTDDNDFVKWTGYGVDTNRSIGINSPTNDAGKKFISAGPLVVYSGSPEGSVLSGDMLASYMRQNGLVK